MPDGKRIAFLPGDPRPAGGLTVIWRTDNSLSRDEKGASVIEFALFAPVLALMAVGISDMSMGYTAKLHVEQAVYRALEKVSVGTNNTTFDYLRAEAAAADGPGGIQPANVEVRNWLECDRVPQASFDGLCAETQDTARYVSVTVNWRYNPQFNYRAWFGSPGPIPIAASASVRIQ